MSASFHRVRYLEYMERPIHTKFDIKACILTLNNTTKNYRHISKICKLGSWAHGTSDSYQMGYLGFYTNSK